MWRMSNAQALIFIALLAVENNQPPPQSSILRLGGVFLKLWSLHFVRCFDCVDPNLRPVDHLWNCRVRKCWLASPRRDESPCCAALLAATTGQINIVVVVLAAAAGAIVGDATGYMVGRRFGLPLIRRYGRYIRLDENRLLIGRYLFFRYGNVVVFFGRFVAVLRMFAALLAGANSMPAGRFFFFNITGGVCWACLFGFGAYAVGAEIYTISGTLSVISLGLFIAAGYALSTCIRRNEASRCSVKRSRSPCRSPCEADQLQSLPA